MSVIMSRRERHLIRNKLNRFSKSLSGWKNLAPYKWYFAALAAMASAEVALRVMMPWAMQLVVDHALGPVPPPRWMTSMAGETRVGWLALAVIAGVVMQAAHQAVLMAHTRLYTRTGHLLTRDMRQRLFIHLQELSLRHHAQLPVGELAYRMQFDATFLDRLIVGGLLPLAFSAITLIVMFSILVKIDWRLALVSLTIVPFLFMWIRWSARRIRPRAEQTQKLESRLSARLHETFASIRLVKSFARESFEASRFAGLADQAMQARVVLSAREAWFALVVGNLLMVGTALVLLVGGKGVIEGRLTIGTLLVALAYLGFVYGPLAGVANTIGTIQQALASARSVRKAFGMATEVEDGKLAPQHLEGRIEFQNVTFGYDRRPVLRSVSFSAGRGEMIAIVGPSGSGKTTLLSLIPRFHDPQSGRILIDGIESRRYRLKFLRQQIAFVQQDVITMAGSIRENLRYGRLDANDEEIEQAARDAQAHDFIMRQPRGYDTSLAEAGSGLSGGERQRLSVARAFLKDAPILILDEPTAALDAASERLVMAAIDRLRQRRTTFVIAHRLTTVLAADRILVLDAGEVVAEGTHETLMTTSQLYRNLATQLTQAGDVHGSDAVRA
jgi:ATP-binding cassette, subfamily B, bacterial